MAGASAAHPIIEDARALLRTLAASDANELFLAAEWREIFICKAGSAHNPLLARASEAVKATDEPADPTAAVAVTAPHVATLAWIAAEGDHVDAGGRLALLSLLGEETEIAAPVAGHVQFAAEPGALLDFETVIARIEPGEAARG